MSAIGDAPCREGADFDPLRKSGRPKCCDAQHGFFNDVVRGIARGAIAFQVADLLRHVAVATIFI
jgi:hypothetical protein